MTNCILNLKLQRAGTETRPYNAERMVMKRIIALCLSLVLLFSLFAACGEKEPDRSYEKIAHEYEWCYFPIGDIDDAEITYSFPPVTCYDDVVLYAKQYCYMTFGELNEDPYSIAHRESDGVWYYTSSVLDFEEIAGYAGAMFIDPIGHRTYRFAITDSGDVIYANMWDYDFSKGSGDFDFIDYKPLEERLSCEGIEFDLSNKFSFSYDDIKDFESHPMFIEKLEPVNSADDVVERAKYLRRRSYGTDELNPYSICYDEKNDCWLYYEMIDADQVLMYFVIDSDGQMLLFTFYIPKLS